MVGPCQVGLGGIRLELRRFADRLLGRSAVREYDRTLALRYVYGRGALHRAQRRACFRAH
jgi:hypothetical protein